MNHSSSLLPNASPAAPRASTGRRFVLGRPNKLDKFCRFGRKERRGTAVVEFAVVAPVMFLLIFALLEFGRAMMVQQMLTNATRQAARQALLDGSSSTQIAAEVEKELAALSIDGVTATVSENAPVAPDYVETVTVSVQVPFSQVSWLPTPIYLTGSSLRAETTMRKESPQ